MSAELYAELCTFLCRCPSLEVLILRFRERRDFHNMTLTLPVWIQSLHLHFDPGVLRWNIGEDEIILPHLRSFPHLREATISANGNDFVSPCWDDETDTVIPPYNDTQKYCEENGVKLHLTKTDSRPSLIDYPSTSEARKIIAST